MKRFLAFIIFVISVGAGVHALADTSTAAFWDNLSQINRIKPLQNPQNTSGKSILERHLIDRQKKVIGEVEDVTLKQDGGAEALTVVLDRLQLTQPVALNFRDLSIRTTAHEYEIKLRDDEVTALYPELLAGIETAAGASADIYSLKAILDHSVIDETGRKIGTMTDVLFDQAAARANSAYIVVDYDAIRDVGVAVPFQTLKFYDDKGQVNISIPKAEADAVIRFAKEKER